MNRRFLSMLMCFVMLAGMFPAGQVKAAEDMISEAVSSDVSASGDAAEAEDVTAAENAEEENAAEESVQEPAAEEVEAAEEAEPEQDTDVAAKDECAAEISQTYSVSQLSVSSNDQRDVEIEVSADQVYVAFFTEDNKYISHVSMNKGGSVSVDDIPKTEDTVSMNFIGWFPFELDSSKAPTTDADGKRTVYVKESEDKWDTSASVNASLRLQAKWQHYVPRIDERDKEIASADGLCYVAFFSRGKYIKHIYTKKGSIISANEVPEIVSGNFTGWYPFTLDTGRSVTIEENGDRVVPVVEDYVRWDQTIRIDEDLRLEARYSNLQMDNASGMNAIYAIQGDEKEIYLVKGQRVSYNQVFTTYPKSTLKLNAAKTWAQAKKVGDATITLPGNKNITVHIVKPKLKSKQAQMFVGDDPVDLDKTGWENLAARECFSRVVWESSNTNIVRMRGSYAYPISKGTATITAYIGGQKYKTKLKVMDRDYYAKPDTQLPVNVNIKKSVKVKYMGVVPRNANWRTGDVTIADVSAKGKVKGIKAGVTTLDCQYGGATYKALINVEDPKPHVDVVDTQLTLNNKLTYVKKKYRIKLEEGTGYVIKYDNADLRQNIVFKSSAPTKVYVDETGLIYARVPNAKATLSAKVNGRSVKIYVNTVKKDSRNVNKPAVCYEIPAVPDDGQDDTGVINKAIQEVGPEDNYTVYLGPGTYNIGCGNGMNPIKNNCIHFDYDNDNVTFVMSKDTVLYVAGNKMADYSVFKVGGKHQEAPTDFTEHITIIGGRIAGEKARHSGSGQGGHGVYISGNTNDIVIKDMIIEDNHGDGIYLGNGAKNVTIDGCTIRNNYRSNISMTDCIDVTVNNCTISGAEGHTPMAGVNIEPNKHTDGLYHTDVKDVVFTKCTISAKADHCSKGDNGLYNYFAFLVHDLDTVQKGANTAQDIIIEDCTFKGDFFNGSGKDMVVKKSTINGDFYDKRGTTLIETTINCKNDKR